MNVVVVVIIILVVVSRGQVIDDGGGRRQKVCQRWLSVESICQRCLVSGPDAIVTRSAANWSRSTHGYTMSTLPLPSPGHPWLHNVVTRFSLAMIIHRTCDARRLFPARRSVWMNWFLAVGDWPTIKVICWKINATRTQRPVRLMSLSHHDEFAFSSAELATEAGLMPCFSGRPT